MVSVGYPDRGARIFIQTAPRMSLAVIHRIAPSDARRVYRRRTIVRSMRFAFPGVINANPDVDSDRKARQFLVFC